MENGMNRRMGAGPTGVVEGKPTTPVGSEITLGAEINAHGLGVKLEFLACSLNSEALS